MGNAAFYAFITTRACVSAALARKKPAAFRTAVRKVAKKAKGMTEVVAPFAFLRGWPQSSAKVHPLFGTQ